MFEHVTQSSLNGAFDSRIDEQMAVLLEQAATQDPMVVIVEIPAQLSRLHFYQALAGQMGRWGKCRHDNAALIDLTNHPAQPAQTQFSGDVHNWSDLADGLSQVLSGADLLVVWGLEGMVQETPHRLAAFLEARARHQVVVVLTTLLLDVCALNMRKTHIQINRSIRDETEFEVGVAAVARLAIQAAHQSARVGGKVSTTEELRPRRPAAGGDAGRT